MDAPDTRKTYPHLINWSACDAAILLVIETWLGIPAMHVSEIFAVDGACGDCGRHDALIADTDLSTTTMWITFHFDA